MLSNKNKIIVACAGSGKTTQIVDEALQIKKHSVLVTTFTIENVELIKSLFVEKHGCIPPNITVQSWFSFLLQEGVRPYQNYMTRRERIVSIFFIESVKDCYKLKKQLWVIPESDDRHYLTKNNYIYNDKVSKFIFNCDERSNGLVIRRLEKNYNFIFIDELQDFAGYDLNLLELFFNSKIKIIAVGDPRQPTYSTNQAQKNKQYKKNIFPWLKEKESEGKISIKENNESFRCNQQICDFADKLYSDLPKSVSKNLTTTGHDGIFFIHADEVNQYVARYTPSILRYNINTDTLGYHATNIGLSKGKTFDRVLIFPTQPMIRYIKSRDIKNVGDKPKLYVAVTRAKYSVAFVVDDETLIKNNCCQAKTNSFL